MFSLTNLVPLLVLSYATVTSVFLISENRRPQATLAWMLVLFILPAVGLVLYFLFGRDRKSFSKETKLLRQTLEADALPLLEPMLSRQERENGFLVPVEGRHRRLVMLARRNSNSALLRTREVEVLKDASTFYPRLIADMEAATHSIHHQYYIWGSDSFTEELKRVMIAKAREDVAVRLLYDPLGSLRYVSRAYLRELSEGGVAVMPTSPLYRLHTINYRNHRKITVIDGALGYTGGMNIGAEHLDGGERFAFWRDTQLSIRGDAAGILQAVFMIDWFNACGENLFAKEYFPASECLDDGVPVQILTSGPDSQWAAIRQLYAHMIGSAQRRVFIQSPFFIPDPTVTEALRLAALSGVDVRLMVSSRASGTALPDWASNTYFGDMTRAGARVFLYEKGYLHAKTIMVDSEISSVGSANIDVRSFSLNYELNAVLYDTELTRELEEHFLDDLEHCREFIWQEYRARGRVLRFRDSAARLLSPLL